MPAKWSDFDYWVNSFQKIKKNIEEMRFLLPTIKDVILYDKLTKLGINSIATLLLYISILFFMGIIKIKRDVKNITRETNKNILGILLSMHRT